MSDHSSIATKEPDNTDIDRSTISVEEGFKSTNNPHEKSTTNLRSDNFDQRSTLSSRQSLVTTPNTCSIHPEEILQFYCFNDNKLLCADCIVRGRYSGMDISNLKKAAERLKKKLGEMAQESNAKVEACASLSKEIEEQQSQVKQIFSTYRDEVREKMSELRKALDAREQELMKQIDTFQEEKMSLVNNTDHNLQGYKEGMEILGYTVQNKLEDLDDLSVCRFYQSKADALKENLDDEIYAKVQRVKKMVERNQVHDQINFFRLRDEWQKAQSAINQIGHGISISKSEQPSMKDLTEPSQTTKSTDNLASSFSKEKSPEMHRLYKETLKAQLMKNDRTKHQQTSSYIGNTTSGLSPKSSPRQTSARSPLMVEVRRGDLSKTESSNSPGFNQPRSPANKVNLYETLQSYKALARETNMKSASTLLSTPRNGTGGSGVSSPKMTSPGKRAFESSMSQIGSYLTFTDVHGSRERLFSPNRVGISVKTDDGLEEYLNLKGRKQPQSPSENNLKSKLKELNAQVFK